MSDQPNDRDKDWLGVLGSKPDFAIKWLHELGWIISFYDKAKQNWKGRLFWWFISKCSFLLCWECTAWWSGTAGIWRLSMEQFAENYNMRIKRAKQSTWPSPVGGFSSKDPKEMTAFNTQTLNIPGNEQRRLLFKSTGKKMQVSSALQGHSLQQRHKAVPNIKW